MQNKRLKSITILAMSLLLGICGCDFKFVFKLSNNQEEHYYSIPFLNIKFGYEEHNFDSNHDCTKCGYHEDYTDGLTYGLSEDESYFIVTGYGEVSEADIKIPSSYNGKKVKEIGLSAFYSCNTLETITLPSSIEKIANGAFHDCENLEKINFANGLKIIDEYAFYCCSALKNIIIPEGVLEIKDYAFSNCAILESVRISSSVSSLGEGFISECPALKEIIVDQNNTVYDSRDNANAIIETKTDKLLFGCKTTLIPSSVKTIGSYSFLACSSLQDITIPNGVTAINEDAFSLCGSLESVSLPDTLLMIDSYAFYTCSSLNSIEIPNSVTTIGDYAFEGCAFESITIPASVTEIGQGILADCEKLTSIIVNSNNQIYDSRNNSNAIIETATNTLLVGSNNATIPASVTEIGYGAFSGCHNLSNIDIPSSVKTIGESAFESCTSLKSVLIPSGVTSIGINAFANCSSLTSIVVDDNNTVYDSRDNCNAIIETESNALFIGCNNTVIPSTVTTLLDSSFISCTELNNLIIPSSVETIGSFVFSFCITLDNIIIPTSLKSIGFGSFLNCDSLSNVYYLGSESDWNNIEIDFWNDSLSFATIYYYSELEPSEDGNFWHYDIDGKTIIIWD